MIKIAIGVLGLAVWASMTSTYGQVLCDHVDYITTPASPPPSYNGCAIDYAFWDCYGVRIYTRSGCSDDLPCKESCDCSATSTRAGR